MPQAAYPPHLLHSYQNKASAFRAAGAERVSTSLINMTKEREVPLIRRTSSRSARASLEGEPSRTSTDEEGTNDATASVDTHSELQGSTTMQHAPAPSSPHQPDGSEFKERSTTGTTDTGGMVSSSAIEPTDKGDSDEAMPRGAPAGESAGAAVAATTPGTARRGRGRPRKKPVEAKGDEEGIPQASSSVPTAPVAGVGESKKEGSKGGQTEGNTIDNANNANAGGAAAGGNESDEWSEDDDVHHLPAEVKAQFGNIVWAKCPRNPPWPALVWDPRFLGKDKPSRNVARMAYASLGKSHLVKFYDSRNSFLAVPYKSITPFDPAELPAHLKTCSGSKKKETLKEDVQEAIEASLLNRSERLSAMHDVGRFGASKKKKKPGKTKEKSKSRQDPRPASAPDAGGGSFSAAAAALPAGPAKKKRRRGRPRKVPVKELDDDAPSPSSDGAEYELELPKEAEGEDSEAAVDGEGGGVEEADAVEEEEEVVEEEEEEEEEAEAEEEEEEEEDDEGGDDDDEEEYTADGEQDEEDKALDETFLAERKASRKRGRPRRGSGRAKPSSSSGRGGDGSASDVEGKLNKRVRPAPLSPRGVTGDGSDGGGAGGRGGVGGKKGRPMVPGEAKARALAEVMKFCAGLPPVEYGRDEGWVATKDEAREGRAGSGAVGGRGSGSVGGKQERAGGDKGETPGREKKPKKLKTAKEERQREESDSKQRLSQMKNSSEPVWQQLRRMKGEKSKDRGTASGTAANGGKAAAGAAAGASGGSGSGGGMKENQISKGRKLTVRLGKVSSQNSFSREEVLDVLQKLGELEPSVELLQQSGCGKAVASVRKYYSGGQMKHNDKTVASAASTLRTRWMGVLGKGTTPSPATGSSSAPGTGTGTGTGGAPGVGASVSTTESAPLAPTPSRARSDTPAGGGDSTGRSSKKQHARAGSEERHRSRSPKNVTAAGGGGGGGWGVGRGRDKGRDNGGRGGGVAEGGRYGGGGREEDEGNSEGAVKKEVAKKEVASAAAAVAAAPVVEKTPAPVVVMDEPRRRALGMLTSVLGVATPAIDRCKSIEEELYESQGKEISKGYLRRLRTAVFSMQGLEAQRLRDKVMSEMVLPRDFVTKSGDELRALAGMV